MSSKTSSLVGAGATRFMSNIMPDWLLAMVCGRPMARVLEFGPTETLTRKGRRLIAPAKWLMPGSDVPAKRGKRYVDVELPQRQLLKRDVKLPKTPRRTLRRVVMLDMLRKTPFKPDQTYSILTDVRSDTVHTTMTHWVARRNDIDALRTRLAQAGLMVRRVNIADIRAEPLADFSAQTYPAGRLWRLANVVAVILALAAGAWLWIQPVWKIQEARIAQEAELQRLTSEAVALRESMKSQSSEETERTAFLDRMTRRTPAVTILRAATVMMPDEVWLTDMAFDRARVTLRGSTSGSAAQMLLDLPRNRLLRNPQLAGPVSQTSDGRERFDIIFQTPQGQP